MNKKHHSLKVPAGYKYLPFTWDAKHCCNEIEMSMDKLTVKSR